MLDQLRILLLPIYEWLDRHEPIVFPRPKGKYSVGRKCFNWIDSEREEKFVEGFGTRREVLVWLWYPANDNGTSEKSLYLPPKWCHRLQLLGERLPRSLELIKCNSTDDASVARDACPAPLLVFLPGLGSLPIHYSAMAEELASQGYFVAGIAGPYTPRLICFPDGREAHGSRAGQVWSRDEDEAMAERGRIISVWIEDLHFVVERICSLSEGSEDATSHSEPDSTTFFRHAIDPQSIGAYGHSLGGTAAAELPNRNHRCRATANMHGWFPPHASREERYVEHTFLYLVPKLLSQHHKQLGHFKDGWQITIDGFLHQYFGDVPLYAGPRTMSYASDLFRKKLIVMPLPGSRAINITSASLVAFFNHHLRNQGENLSLLSKEFGEITVEKLPD